MPTNETEEFEFRLRAEKEGLKAKPAVAAKEPVEKPVNKEMPYGTGGFISGNIYKGAAGLVGAPVDLSRAAINLVKPGQPIPSSSPGGSEWFEGGLRKVGLINESSTPTTPGGKFAAESIQLGSQFATPALRGAMQVPRLAGEAARAGGKKISELASNFTGGRAATARAEASGAARSAIESGAGALETAGQVEASKAARMTQVQSRIDAQLAEARAPNAKNTFDVQGNTVRQAFTGAMQSAKAARAETADKLFTQVRQDAAVKELTGARVNTSAVEESLAQFAKEAEGIPDLEAATNKMLTSIRGRPAAAALQVWTPPGSQSLPQAAAQGKTFEQLELTRRYLNDIAYSGDVEGYSAIVRNKARDTAQQVDAAMQEFVPSFGAYKSTYAQMSEPLNSLGTRFGKALSGTEGGLKGEAYAKVANSDLPSRLFSKKEGGELLVDALSGGKNASPEMRARAQKQVDEMVENWIVESSRMQPAKAALEGLAAPKMQGSLAATPSVVPKVTSRLEARAGLEAASETAAKKAGALSAGGAKATEAATKMRTDIEIADTLASQPGAKSQQAAYDGYVKALGTARRAGVIQPEQYKSAQALIDKAATLEERTATIRRILKRVVWGGAAAAGGYEASKLF